MEPPPIHVNDVISSDHDNDDNDVDSSDLSDNEWEDAKQLFQQLRNNDKYKTLWDAFAAGANTTLREGTNRRQSSPRDRRRLRTSSGVCQDECCLPKTFIPLGLLTKTAENGNDELVGTMERLDLNGNKDADDETNERHESQTSRDSTAGTDSDADDFNESSSSEESIVRFDHISFEASPRSRSSGSNPQSTGDRNVVEVLSDDDDDEGTDALVVNSREPVKHVYEAPSSEREAANDTRRTRQPLVLEVDSDSDDGETWSPPKCKSPRMAPSSQEVATGSYGSSDEEGYDLDASASEAITAPRQGDSDADSCSSSENSWQGGLDDDFLADKRKQVVDPPRTAIAVLEDSDDDDEEEEDSNNCAKKAVPERVQAPTPSRRRPNTSTSTASKSPFLKTREELSKSLFNQLDTRVFHGKLGAEGVEITWSKRLSSTAGKTILRRGKGSHADIYKADIELSSTILDREARLRSTLLHEMCHAAAWIVDKNDNPPHGPVFQKWARRAQAQTGVPVTTTHTYKIAKYAWACQTVGCSVKIERPTKSFKPEGVVCAKCKGTFIQVDIDTGKPLLAREKRPPSKYNLFVKQHSKAVREALEATSGGRKVSQADVMTELAQRWK